MHVRLQIAYNFPPGATQCVRGALVHTGNPYHGYKDTKTASNDDKLVQARLPSFEILNIVHSIFIGVQAADHYYSSIHPADK